MRVKSRAAAMHTWNMKQYASLVLVSLLALLGCMETIYNYTSGNNLSSRGVLSLDVVPASSLRQNVPIMEQQQFSVKEDSKMTESNEQSTEKLTAEQPNDNYSNISRYISPLEEFGIEEGSSLPAPLSVIEQYKAWHSQEALEHDANIQNRNFIIAYYQAPSSVGNYLHYFTSAFYWGLLTNRTILWKYMDVDTCIDIVHSSKNYFNEPRCRVPNTTQADSEKVITRAPWIPGYDEWKERLNLPETHHIIRDHTQWHKKGGVVIDGLNVHVKTSSRYSKFVDTYYKNERVVDIHPWAFLRMDYHYWMPDIIDLQLETAYAKETIQLLGAWGSDVLFGILWRYSFDYASDIRTSVERQAVVHQQAILADEESLSIAMHSRHTTPSDKGCDVSLEQAGFRDILRQHRHRNDLSIREQGRVPSVCQVTLLSDRTCTIDNMRDWLEHMGCKAVTVDHEVNVGTRTEHGPFSGAGFFKDMLLAGLTVQNGMIGSLETWDGDRWRSSSELVEESVAYIRAMRYYKAGKDPKDLPKLYWATVVRGKRKFYKLSDTKTI
ncbi:hypothetical protein MPSEU_000759500 [Mayamaea pseudoterrestris]|nr:hypothetical protein MPSEU_000759500 [Mayamaea pseudoterrestris]